MPAQRSKTHMISDSNRADSQDLGPPSARTQPNPEDEQDRMENPLAANGSLSLVEESIRKQSALHGGSEIENYNSVFEMEVGKPLTIGDYAKWKKADDDLPVGSIGEVIGFKKNGRIRLRFSPEKTYSFRTKNVLRASMVEVAAYKKQVAAGWPTDPRGCAGWQRANPERVLAFPADAMAGRKTRAEVK